ncbi:hypothetical protein OESDEN_04700 [Oesophagostomum dentatum]|uniref:Uncharacterized protein n=1 Tax=Oesophagostomum dentatum TaxID=61180 RepID=A0A0B1TIV8_OESDE|nr:hypothetical protein OESDEN_04700 [Oesophagostomum dentatum]
MSTVYADSEPKSSSTNVRPHAVKLTQDELKSYYWVLGNLQRHLNEKKLKTDDEIRNALGDFFYPSL